MSQYTLKPKFTERSQIGATALPPLFAHLTLPLIDFLAVAPPDRCRVLVATGAEEAAMLMLRETLRLRVIFERNTYLNREFETLIRI